MCICAKSLLGKTEKRKGEVRRKMMKFCHSSTRDDQEGHSQMHGWGSRVKLSGLRAVKMSSMLIRLFNKRCLNK